MTQWSPTTQSPQTNREGFALVTTLLIILVLSVLAVGIAWLASSEKKTSFAESVHVSSVFSADAGGEAGINFIRMAAAPPSYAGADKVVNVQGTTAIEGTQTYNYDARMLGRTPRIGWEGSYADFDYAIESHGTASTNGEATIQLVASRLFKLGY